MSRCPMIVGGCYCICYSPECHFLHFILNNLASGHKEPRFVKGDSNTHSNRKYTGDGIIKMLQFLIDSIFLASSKLSAFQLELIPLFSAASSFYSHTKRNSEGEEKAFHSNFTYRYIDDVLSIYIPSF